MIDKLNEHYSFTAPPSVFDEEALTALELAGRTAHKVNEVVELVNQNEADTKEMIEKGMPAAVTAEVQEQIENGTFDSQIDKYAGELSAEIENTKTMTAAMVAAAKSENAQDITQAEKMLNARVDSLVAAPSGSTQLDTEIIDLRTNAFGNTASSAGASVRSMEEYILKRTKGQCLGIVSGNIGDINIDTNNNTITCVSRTYIGENNIFIGKPTDLTYAAVNATHALYIDCVNKQLTLVNATADIKCSDHILLAHIYLNASGGINYIAAPECVLDVLTLDGVWYKGQKLKQGNEKVIWTNGQFNIDTVNNLISFSSLVFTDKTQFYYARNIEPLDYTDVEIPTAGTTKTLVIANGNKLAFDDARRYNNTFVAQIWFNADRTIQQVLCDYGLYNKLYVDGVLYGTKYALDKPTDTPATHTNRTLAMFDKIVCCGDSFTSGHMMKPDGSISATTSNAAWARHLEKLTGGTFINCGVSGANVITWQSNTGGLAKAQAAGKAQGYIIGLGLNDCSNSDRAVEVGTAADIGTDAQTYYGGLSAIIRELKAVSPDAKIFVLTMPDRGNSVYNAAIVDVCAAYQSTYDTHCIDLRNYQGKFANMATDGSGHPSAAGQAVAAQIICEAMSAYIVNNAASFNDVPFIEYE